MTANGLKLNPLSSNFPLLYPLKRQVNEKFSDVCRECGNETLVENELSTDIRRRNSILSACLEYVNVFCKLNPYIRCKLL